MRRYAHLKSAADDSGKWIVKVMLFEAEDGVSLFEYDSPDANQCVLDRRYETLDEVYEEWNGLLDGRGWIDLADPLPDCQHDAFLPIRIKGRNTGKPEWGKFEIFEDGEWKEYLP